MRITYPMPQLSLWVDHIPQDSSFRKLRASCSSVRRLQELHMKHCHYDNKISASCSIAHILRHNPSQYYSISHPPVRDFDQQISSLQQEYPGQGTADNQWELYHS